MSTSGMRRDPSRRPLPPLVGPAHVSRAALGFVRVITSVHGVACRSGGRRPTMRADGVRNHVAIFPLSSRGAERPRVHEKLDPACRPDVDRGDDRPWSGCGCRERGRGRAPRRAGDHAGGGRWTGRCRGGGTDRRPHPVLQLRSRRRHAAGHRRYAVQHRVGAQGVRRDPGGAGRARGRAPARRPDCQARPRAAAWRRHRPHHRRPACDPHVRPAATARLPALARAPHHAGRTLRHGQCLAGRGAPRHAAYLYPRRLRTAAARAGAPVRDADRPAARAPRARAARHGIDHAAAKRPIAPGSRPPRRAGLWRARRAIRRTRRRARFL